MSAPRQPGPAALTFAFATVGAFLVTGLATSAAMVASAALQGIPLDSLSENPEAAFTAGLVGFSAGLQGTLLALVAVGLAYGFAEQRTDRIRPVLGASTLGWWGFSFAAAVGALTVGFLPGWIGSQIVAYDPSLGGTMTILAEQMATGTVGGKLFLAVAVCVAAPVGEELAFRGFLWHHLEQWLPSWGVWCLTSLLFVGYHFDPVQTPSLLPTALFLGWLRWKSGSVAPAILGHAVNNLLATVLLWRTAVDGPFTIPLSWAIAGTAVTIGCCAAAALARPRS